jgi:uncharacterized protein involved in exopolysaccharide biosynthesis
MSQHDKPTTHEDEINLYDYWKTIAKRKRLIIGLFLASIIITALASLLMPKVYQATTSIMIIPSHLQAALSPTEIFLDTRRTGVAAEASIIPIPTHRTLLESNTTLERIIDRLKLTDHLGKPLTPDSLNEQLNVEEIKGTNVLRLEVEESRPWRAKEIANVWAEEYLKYNHELILGEVGGVGDFVVHQFEIARDNLIRSEKALKDFKDKYITDLMRAKLNIKKDKLNTERREHLNLALILKTKKDSLRELKEQIKNEERFIVVSKAITDDILLWQREAGKGDIKNLDDKKLRSEEINPLYQDLRTRIANTEIEINTLKSRSDHIEKSIELTRKEIEELEKKVNQQEFELTQLNRQVAIHKATHDNLALRLEETRIAKAMELGEARIVSSATEPESPISPNKGLNIALAGVISLFAGIFLAFFMEFIQKARGQQLKDD